MNTKRNKNAQSPSRANYERNNPTVSARLPVEVRDQLLRDLETAGLTMTNAFELLAGVMHTKAISLEQAEKRGFEKAKRLYAVPYPCYICEGQLLITSSETKKVVSEFLTKHGWGHTKCVDVTGNK